MKIAELYNIEISLYNILKNSIYLLIISLQIFKKLLFYTKI